MNQLSCCADSCAHHKDGYCCLSSIEVGGCHAEKPSSTQCNSFVEKGSEFTDSVEDMASPTSDIKCEAKNCMYNNNCNCEADNVDISGHCASQSEETLCSTFCSE